MSDWLVCPICECQATITEGQYRSLMTGEVLTRDQLGKPGPGWAWTRDSDTVSFPCGGYGLLFDGSVWHLIDEENFSE